MQIATPSGSINRVMPQHNSIAAAATATAEDEAVSKAEAHIYWSNYFREHWRQWLMLLSVFAIIYCVDCVANINARLYGVTSAIPGAPAAATSATIATIKSPPPPSPIWSAWWTWFLAQCAAIQKTALRRKGSGRVAKGGRRRNG